MTLRRRVLLAAALSLALLVVSGSFLVQQYIGTVRAQNYLRDALAPASDAAQSLVLAQANASGALSDYVLLGRPESLVTYQISRARAEVLLTQVDPGVTVSSDLASLLAAARSAQSEWVSLDASPTLEQMARGDIAAARQVTGSNQAWDSYQGMNLASERLLIAVNDRRDSAADLAQRFTRLLGIFLCFAALLLVSLVIGIYVSLNSVVLRPLDLLKDSIQRATHEKRHEHVIVPTGPPEIAAVGTDAEILRRRLVAEIDVSMAAQEGLAQEAPVVSAMFSAQVVSHDVKVEGLEIYGTTQAAEGVMSGDWWDAVLRPDGSLGVVVADVSGHGPEAGVTAVRMRPLLQAGLMSGASPDFILELASATMAASEHFITVLLIVIDPKVGSLTWANAGHEPGLIIRADNEVIECEPTGRMLSSLGGIWTSQSCSFVIGDLFLAFTDGLVESKGSDGRKPTGQQISQYLQTCSASDRLDVQEISQVILARARQVSTDWDRDDVTLVAVARQR